MLGGKRENSGRKLLSKDIKKKGITIYLNQKEQEEINQSIIGNSFSSKCVSLIKLALKEHCNYNNNNVIKFIDLFAGMGGIRIGFEQAMQAYGWQTECILLSELKPYAIRAYQNYFREDQVQGDITKIPSHQIEDFDFMLAGFPCQPFSSAGNRLGFMDTRGTLFFEVERILRDKQPYGFILENVEGLINHDKGKTLQTILTSLTNLGYQVTYQLLDGLNFGLAQSRKRVYIVGTKDHAINLDNFLTRTSTFAQIQEHIPNLTNSPFSQKLLQHYSPQELYGKSIKDKRGGKDNIHSWEIEIKGEVSSDQKQLLNTLLTERRKKKWASLIGIDWMDGMPLTLEQIASFFPHDHLLDLLEDLVAKKYLAFEHPKQLVQGKRVYDTTKPKGYNIVTGKLSFEYSNILNPHSITPTLVATDVQKLGVIDQGVIRKLTVREAQRLFGFPEDYSLDMLKYQQSMDLLGNTVCIPVIKDITSRIAQHLITLPKLEHIRSHSHPSLN